MRKRTFRLLKADEIELRVGQVSKVDARPWYTLLLYKDARCDMNILDETLGAENWKREHLIIKDNLFCRVSVRYPYYIDVLDKDGKPTGAVDIAGYSDWVYKEDVGVPSQTESEKGESSDSFKRACVNIGIGRELYTAPLIFVNEPWKDVGSRRALVVADITYDLSGNIETVTITDRKDDTFVKVFRRK